MDHRASIRNGHLSMLPILILTVIAFAFGAITTRTFLDTAPHVVMSTGLILGVTWGAVFGLTGLIPLAGFMLGALAWVLRPPWNRKKTTREPDRVQEREDPDSLNQRIRDLKVARSRFDKNDPLRSDFDAIIASLEQEANREN